MTQTAASIDYEAVPTPADLPDDMQPFPGASLRFLSIKTIDGFKVQAALWQPEHKPPSETTIIVGVHGSGGNLASLPLRATARRLSAEGYAALSISTRQHDEHVNTDNFFDVRRDIEAAIATVKALCYRSIVLHGHSLGTVQVLYYAATNWDPAIKAVILTGAFGKLPWKSRHILIQDEDNYRALTEASLRALRDGKAAEVLSIKMRWLGGVESRLRRSTSSLIETSRRARPTAPTGSLAFHVRS
jgi:pimeloyl-ACP methyl ester carboxylesterase